MSLLKVLNLTASGMSATSVRMTTIASNMANAQSVAKNQNDTYRAKEVVFEAVYDKERFGKIGQGVQVTEILKSQRPFTLTYQPEHPYADKNGYVSLPNVNMMEEVANMMSASQTYRALVEASKTSANLLTQTLSLGRL